MTISARKLLFFLVVLIPVLALADEQEKAHKILNKLTALTADPAGKRAVSLAVSQYLSVARKELAQRRRAMNLNYGEIFVAYELTRQGLSLEDILGRITIGKTAWQIADEEHLNWKRVADDAKKVNSKADIKLLEHFTKKSTEEDQDRADGYDPFHDSVKADGKVSQREVEDAQQRFTFLRDHAVVVSGTGLDPESERSVRTVRPDPTTTEARVGAGEHSAPR